MMNREELIKYLKEQVALFADFDQDTLGNLVDDSIFRTAEKSEAILEFGRKGRFLGVLLKGEAVASIIDDGGKLQEFAKLQPGEIFGEMALMSGDRSMANLVASTYCAFLMIPAALFTSLVLTHPAAMAYLVKLLTERSKILALEEQKRLLANRAEIKSNDPYGFELKSDTPHSILVINCGSSSLKYSLFDTEKKEARIGGMVEKIGSDSAVHLSGGNKKPVDCAEHAVAFDIVLESLTERGFIKSASDITAVGHRVVHGGERFAGPVIITGEVVEQIRKLSPLAPLHNPINLKGIELAQKAFPDAAQVAVFDTSFHHTLPPYAYLYGLPYKYYKEHRVRRYGFHGLSHSYVSLKAAQFLGRPYTSIETVTCHLGNGSSVCAVDHGRSVDTSMGMTPSAGLMMGTRSGDIDPGALAFIARNENLDGNDIDDLINRQSGLLGLSTISGDMRELTDAARGGHHHALIAIKTFCYNLRKYIGSYVAAMQGLDAVVFTGGIGENSAGVRSLACQGLECMGIELDDKKNRDADGTGVPVDIATEKSKVRVLVIPTDEELMIARDTLNTVLTQRMELDVKEMEIPVEVSAHHIHLSEEHVNVLFGKGHKLTPIAELSQPGQFACDEKVDLAGPRGVVKNVRVLGPVRKETQVEISMTEQFKLGLHPPIRESGDLDGTPGVRLEGPAGTIDIKQGVICAMRHIHMSPKDAMVLGVRDRYVVRVVVQGDRELVFGDVMVRVSPAYALAMHIDTDEANAANITTGSIGHIESVQSRT